MLAQLATEYAPALLQVGVAGAMLLWFSLDNSKRMRAMETSVDRMAKASLLQIISVGHLNSAVTDQAKELLDQIKEKERK